MSRCNLKKGTCKVSVNVKNSEFRITGNGNKKRNLSGSLAQYVVNEKVHIMPEFPFCS